MRLGRGVKQLRRKDEFGATMVEGAIVAGFVFLIIILIVEGALFARTYLAAKDAVTSGSRAGSVGANDPLADYDILQAINKSLSATSKQQLISIVVFAPQGASNTMPSSCKNSGVPGICNRYVASDLTRPESDFQGVGGFEAATFWPASARSTDLTIGVSRLGIYVEMRSGGFTGILPGTVSSNSIVELEPHTN